MELYLQDSLNYLSEQIKRAFSPSVCEYQLSVGSLES